MYGMRVVVVLLLSLWLAGGVALQLFTARFGATIIRAGGGTLFASLVMAIFLFASFYVIAQSCGAISDERQRATLGLLFLTPLQPRHVALAKLVSRCCEGIQIGLVSLPLIFVPYLMGGVRGGQILSAFAVILAQVMICASLTLCLSAWCRSAVASFGLAVLLLAGVEVGSLLLAGMETAIFSTQYLAVLEFMNPLALMGRQFSMGGGDPWGVAILVALAAAFAIVMQALTSWQLRRILAGSTEGAARRGRSPSSRPRRTGRRSVVDEWQPVYWLEWRRKSAARRVWACALVAASVVVTALVTGAMGFGDAALVAAYLASSCAWIVNLLMAVSVARSVQFQKQERFLELVMTTPLRDCEWVNQRLRAAWGAYGVPLFFMILVPIVLLALSSSWSLLGSLSFPKEYEISLLISLLLGPFASWYMLATVAIWSGLAAKSAGDAVARLFLFYVGWSVAAYVINLLLFFIPFILLSGMASPWMYLGQNVDIVGKAMIGLYVHGRLKAGLRVRLAD